MVRGASQRKLSQSPSLQAACAGVGIAAGARHKLLGAIPGCCNSAFSQAIERRLCRHRGPRRAPPPPSPTPVPCPHLPSSTPLQRAAAGVSQDRPTESGAHQQHAAIAFPHGGPGSHSLPCHGGGGHACASPQPSNDRVGLCAAWSAANAPVAFRGDPSRRRCRAGSPQSRARRRDAHPLSPRSAGSAARPGAAGCTQG